jgi:hypothetical protein
MRRDRVPGLGQNALHPFQCQRIDGLAIGLATVPAHIPLGERFCHRIRVEVAIQRWRRRQRHSPLTQRIGEIVDSATGPKPVIQHHPRFTSPKNIFSGLAIHKTQQAIGCLDPLWSRAVGRIPHPRSPRGGRLLHVIEDTSMSDLNEPAGVDIEQKHRALHPIGIGKTSDERDARTVGITHLPHLTSRPDRGSCPSHCGCCRSATPPRNCFFARPSAAHALDRNAGDPIDVRPCSNRHAGSHPPSRLLTSSRMRTTAAFVSSSNHQLNHNPWRSSRTTRYSSPPNSSAVACSSSPGPRAAMTTPARSSKAFVEESNHDGRCGGPSSDAHAVPAQRR